MTEISDRRLIICYNVLDDILYGHAEYHLDSIEVDALKDAKDIVGTIQERRNKETAQRALKQG